MGDDKIQVFSNCGWLYVVHQNGLPNFRYDNPNPYLGKDFLSLFAFSLSGIACKERESQAQDQKSRRVPPSLYVRVPPTCDIVMSATQ